MILPFVESHPTDYASIPHSCARSVRPASRGVHPCAADIQTGPSLPPPPPSPLSTMPASVSWASFLESGHREDGSVPPLQFEQVPFDHPAYILFSSGTTGHPKCLVHSVGVRAAPVASAPRQQPLGPGSHVPRPFP